MITRIIDILVSLLGLIGLTIMLPFVALLIKLNSRGPVFYSCDRVGLGGRIFKMYKFRTMYETPAALGPSVSPMGDPRVTPVGRLLRRLKLNEIPQFINLLKGEMTLFGPRPESPDLAAAYPEEARKIFTVKPGLIGPNQIQGRNEEESYPRGVDPITYYIETLLPLKLPLDLQYIEDRSFLKNFKLFFQAIWVILTGALGRRHLFDNWTQILLLLGDVLLCLASFTLAHLMRYDGLGPAYDLAVFYKILPLAVLVRLPVFFYLGFYHTLIRYLSLSDIKRVIKGVAASSLALIGIAFILGIIWGYSRGVFLIDWFCLTFMLTGYRLLAWRYRQYQRSKTLPNFEKTNVLIWGAGDCGELCLRFLKKERQPAYEVMGFIDDDSRKRGRRIHGRKILGDHHQLGLLSQLYKITKIFVAIAAIPQHELKKVFRTCQHLGIEVEVFFLEKPHMARDLDMQKASANGYFNKAGMRE
ncbi:hypothetical protein D4S03_06325 [bacterium]|nr:MAG: hypothetical protein D4S03_06325 [bacterium]